jgi:hypothetical protein
MKRYMETDGMSMLLNNCIMVARQRGKNEICCTRAFPQTRSSNDWFWKV